VKLTVHVAAGDPTRREDVSPLVYDQRSGNVYVGYSLGRGEHYRVYNFMQRQGALTAAVASQAHGYHRPDGTFEWYEYFPVPSRLEERELRAAITGDAVADDRAQRTVAAARRRLRPLRVQAGRAAGAAGELRRIFRPPRPRGVSRVREVKRAAPYPEFLSADGYASWCRHVLADEGLSVDATIDNDWWFCKSDWLEYFFRELAPESPFVLFSGNSDRTIDRRLARFLRRPSLVAWFANNVAVEHPRLFPLPLGIGEPSAVHGDAGERLREVRSAIVPKTRLFSVSFDVKTNPQERIRCLAETGLELDAPTDARDYLERLASAYFCVAPCGNGIDTHRTWEALYVRTVPVVTRSVLTERYPELPLVVLDDWSQFDSIDFSRGTYDRTWGAWRPGELSLDSHLQRVLQELSRRSRAAASA
jgi:hypothetical protein